MDGLEIKKHRKRLGLTQEKLAKMIGVSTKTIVNYEGGGVIPESKKDILSVILKSDDINPDDYVKDHNGELVYFPITEFSNNFSKNELVKTSNEVLNQIENYKKAIDTLHEIRKTIIGHIEVLEMIEEQEKIWNDMKNIE